MPTHVLDFAHGSLPFRQAVPTGTLGTTNVARTAVYTTPAGGFCSYPAQFRSLAQSPTPWRRQFAAGGLAGLEDAAPAGRCKAERVLTDAERAQLVTPAQRPHLRAGPGERHQGMDRHLE
jgi:hypothetical protein